MLPPQDGEGDRGGIVAVSAIQSFPRSSFTQGVGLAGEVCGMEHRCQHGAFAVRQVVSNLGSPRDQMADVFVVHRPEPAAIVVPTAALADVEAELVGDVLNGIEGFPSAEILSVTSSFRSMYMVSRREIGDK
ncbi:MAG: hypothetical protein KGI75_11710 [Rhizobiaceae bacterium]|nr:hypothetical protein [Rhizobiaceae bacterium]